MKSSLSILLDILLLALMLSAGLPTLIFATNVFLHDSAYGFDSYREKSVVALDAQVEDLGLAANLDGKRPWNNAHLFMISVVDDGYDNKGNALSTRALRVNGMPWNGGGGIVYIYGVSASDRLNKSTMMQQNEVSGIIPFNANAFTVSNQLYHIYINESGSIGFSAAVPRAEVN